MWSTDNEGQMSEEDELLCELLLQAEIVCARFEGAHRERSGKLPEGELTSKLGQCRGALTQLQSLYEEDLLTVSNTFALAMFRQLVISLMWSYFYAREATDYKLFRKLVLIESSFTSLLLRNVSNSNGLI